MAYIDHFIKPNLNTHYFQVPKKPLPECVLLYHILGPTINLNKFKVFVYVWNVFSVYSGIKLEVNNRKTIGKISNT